MNDIEKILNKLNISLNNEGKFWRARPPYRDSSNDTSLRIHKDTGSFVDFSANIRGSIYDLVKLCLGLETIQEAKTWVGNDLHDNSEPKKVKMTVDNKTDSKYYTNLVPNFSFYVKRRGISQEVMDEFECGVCLAGKMNNRFVFPIRNIDGDVIGVAGRDLLDSRVKWKLLGPKKKWIFPLQSEKYVVNSGECFLVESIGDCLALFNAGIKNVYVLFGVEISPALLNYISSLNLKKIYISTNNDFSKKENWGQLAAEGIYKKLSHLIDESKLQIALPYLNDWGDFKDPKLIQEYVEKIRSGAG